MSGRAGEPPEPPELDAAHGPEPDARGSLERPAFAHPEWTVGLVLVIAMVMLLLGIVGHPIWLLIGSPFILTLAVWVAVRLVQRSRRRRALGNER